MKLTTLVDLLKDRVGSTCFAATNADDFFRQINLLGIKEVEVSRAEMMSIVRVYLANVGSDKNGNQGQIIKEDKLDRFMGVDLVEI